MKNIEKTKYNSKLEMHTKQRQKWLLEKQLQLTLQYFLTELSHKKKKNYYYQFYQQLTSTKTSSQIVHLNSVSRSFVSFVFTSITASQFWPTSFELISVTVWVKEMIRKRRKKIMNSISMNYQFKLTPTTILINSIFLVRIYDWF